jgi:hypothetical protein
MHILFIFVNYLINLIFLSHPTVLFAQHRGGFAGARDRRRLIWAIR